MSYKLKTKEKGFTIIEVMIVLAIAGLIMLIVFLAVPALQRNSRNTARRNDAARLAAAVNSFYANNNAATPGATKATNDANAIVQEAGTLSAYGTLTGAGGAGAAAACTAGSLTAGNLTICTYANVQLTAPATDGIVLATGTQCGTNGQLASGGSRNFALFYTLEGGSGTVISCLNV